MIVSIQDIENAINRYKAQHRIHDSILPPELRVMAEVWGGMIASKVSEINLDDFPSDRRQIIETWLAEAARVAQN